MHNGNGKADLGMAASVALTSPTDTPSVHALLGAREQGAPVDPLRPIIRMLLSDLGVDVDGQHLRDTPARVARFFREYTRGYHFDPAEILKTFHTRNNGLIVVSDIEFFSLCPHHLLVYGGKMHFGYIPDGRIVGISKIPRLVQGLAARLVVQEDLVADIADAFMSVVNKTKTLLIASTRMLVVVDDLQKSQRHPGGDQNGAMAILDVLYGA